MFTCESEPRVSCELVAYERSVTIGNTLKSFNADVG